VFASVLCIADFEDIDFDPVMAESTMSEDWAKRQQAQAAGFDAIARRV
jgi:hypothetical protein